MHLHVGSSSIRAFSGGRRKRRRRDLGAIDDDAASAGVNFAVGTIERERSEHPPFATAAFVSVPC